METARGERGTGREREGDLGTMSKPDLKEKEKESERVSSGLFPTD